MKRTWIVLGAIALVVVLVAGSVAAGVVLARNQRGIGTAWRGMMGSAWRSGEVQANPQRYGMMGGNWGNGPCAGTRQGYGTVGPGMMGGTWDDGQCAGTQPGYGMMGRGMMGRGAVGACGGGYTSPGQGQIGSLDDAKAAVERYVQDLGDANLEVTEVMEFERNYYAIVAEKDTGIGAMELLVDQSTGVVGPEMGPNMMWNAKYGMMGRRGMMGRGGMMGGFPSGEMTLSAEQATETAQKWLDANLPGRTAGEADPFYGYYTLHFKKDGEVDGMLSVNGSTGDVWFHSWHGDFVAGTE